MPLCAYEGSPPLRIKCHQFISQFKLSSSHESPFSFPPTIFLSLLKHLPQSFFKQVLIKFSLSFTHLVRWNREKYGKWNQTKYIAGDEQHASFVSAASFISTPFTTTSSQFISHFLFFLLRSSSFESQRVNGE